MFRSIHNPIAYANNTKQANKICKKSKYVAFEFKGDKTGTFTGFCTAKTKINERVACLFYYEKNVQVPGSIPSVVGES